MKTWESSLLGKSARNLSARRWRRFFLEMLDKRSHFRRNQSAIALIVLQLISKYPYIESIWIRFFLTRLFPFDPLEEESCDLEIFIFTSWKDLEILPLSVLGASQCHKGKVTRITVVHPHIIREEVTVILDSLSQLAIPLLQMSDEQLLSSYSLSDNSFSRSNIKMEIVKIIAAFESQERFSLLIDGDTVLLRPRNWATKDNYLLIVAQEYTRAHIDYHRAFFRNYKNQGLGFVTHHQLIKTKNIRSLVSTFGGIISMATSFEECSLDFYTKNGQRFPSEWQLIGDFQFSEETQLVKLANFSNVGLSRTRLRLLFLGLRDVTLLQNQLDMLRKKTPGLGSISFHQYKD
jgi:hypothetical protein